MILKPIAAAVKHAIIPSAVQSVGAFTASAVAETAPKNLLSAATLIRGGSKALIDLDRTGLRLESLEEYTGKPMCRTKYDISTFLLISL